MDQMAIKYTNIFHCKTLQKLPKLVFLVRKYAIWQPFVKRAYPRTVFLVRMVANLGAELQTKVKITDIT
jgi:hypothetical protein